MNKLEIAKDIVGVIGFASFIYGVTLIHLPAAFISAGVLMVAWAVIK